MVGEFAESAGQATGGYLQADRRVGTYIVELNMERERSVVGDGRNLALSGRIVPRPY